MRARPGNASARPCYTPPVHVRAARATPIALLSSLAAACGGGGPTGPGPGPTPTPGSPVSGFVFYDENANGTLEPNETMRLPGVTVAIGSATAQTTQGGRFTVPSVPAGSPSAGLRADGLPAYFIPGAQVPVAVPQAAGTEVSLPATLPTSGNRPRFYMAFGDSITDGVGSNDFSGYRSYLSADLRSYWGSSHEVLNEGVSATRSNRGESRMGTSLARTDPAYALILYGTNDWNDCRGEVPCYTIDSLRSIVLQARDFGTQPVLGTIPPVNPEYLDRQPTERNDWVRRMNDEIKAMAAQERVAVADIHAAFLSRSSLPSLYWDFLHPNEMGYALVAQTWLQALTRPVGSATTTRRGLFLGPGESSSF